MRFVDEAEISVRAGNGGSGCISFRRGPYEPKGGPDGGDGGKGGDIVFIASTQLETLEDVTLKRIYRAGNGMPGQGSRKNGKGGKDCIIHVPAGTLIYDAENELPMADLEEENARVIIAHGGKGGRGNVHFKTPTNRAPRRADTGIPGETKSIRLELKLIADVGLVGRPNAGKSTLLAAMTDAKPTIASYPYSTLYPGRGVMYHGVYDRIVIADIPGLGEGASTGKGLGRRFLRHIERTKLMVMLIEAPEEDYQVAFEQLQHEIDSFSPEHRKLPRMVIKSKIDLEANGGEFKFDLQVSAETGEGIEELKQMLYDRITELRDKAKLELE